MQGNKLSVDSSIEMAKMKSGNNPDMVAVAKAIAEACQNEVGADR